MKNTLAIILLFVSLFAHSQTVLLPGNEKPFDVEGANKTSIQYTGIAGLSAIQFTLNAADKIIGYSKRSEMSWPFWTGKKETWVSFKTYISSPYPKDVSAESIAQWHDMPDTGIIGADGKKETWRSPPVILIIRNDSMRLITMWSKDKVNSFSNEFETGGTDIDGKIEFNLGKVETDRWIDWQFHIKFSYRKNGILQVVKDGRHVVNYYGPNSYNDAFYPTFKFGLYKWDWNNPLNTSTTTQRIIYFSNPIVRYKNR